MERIKRFMFYLITGSLLLFNSNISFASTASIQKKEVLQAQQDLNPYTISLYEPNYIMPFAYTSSFNSAAQADVPENAKLNNIETKFQLSVKAAVWRNFFGYKNSLNLAYTQLSFWQVYNKKTQFFRESNYKPEIFFANNIDKNIAGNWSINFINAGAMHQSNGRGGNYERSWDRLYVESIFSNPNWLISIRPWYVIHDAGLENNPNIANYLGHERILISYQFSKQVLSLAAYNIENINRTSTQLTWSFPLVRQFRGYVQAFSGYGQSLIEYNHHESTISIGIALNDWI